LAINSGELDERDYVITSTPPKVISLDPAKEVKANVEKIQAGLTTNKDVLVAEGVSWRDVMNDREDEILHAYKIATNVVMKTGEQWSTRDILGMNKNFNPSVFQTEQVEDDDNNTDTE
jgi:predicted RNA-binding protein